MTLILERMGVTTTASSALPPDAALNVNMISHGINSWHNKRVTLVKDKSEGVGSSKQLVICTCGGTADISNEKSGNVRTQEKKMRPLIQSHTVSHSLTHTIIIITA
jgi:hypothetical protein